MASECGCPCAWSTNGGSILLSDANWEHVSSVYDKMIFSVDHLAPKHSRLTTDMVQEFYSSGVQPNWKPSSYAFWPKQERSRASSRVCFSKLDAGLAVRK